MILFPHSWFCRYGTVPYPRYLILLPSHLCLLPLTIILPVPVFCCKKGNIGYDEGHQKIASWVTFIPYLGTVCGSLRKSVFRIRIRLGTGSTKAKTKCLMQCCGSGTFIPNPGSWFFTIPVPGLTPKRFLLRSLKYGLGSVSPVLKRTVKALLVKCP